MQSAPRLFRRHPTSKPSLRTAHSAGAMLECPFPPLALTTEDQYVLRGVAETIQTEMLTQYEQYLALPPQHRLPPSQWKQVKQHGDYRVFKGPWSSAATQNRELNMILGVGTLEGPLNDFMYGCLNQSFEEMRVKSAYCKDTLEHGANLAILQEPTLESPFTSMTLRWLVKALPFPLHMLTNHHDLIVIESTRVARLSNGEPVFVYLLHSIEFPELPPQPNFTRVSVSLGGVCHQMDPSSIHCFGRCILDTKISLLEPLVVTAAANAAITNHTSVMEAALCKKIAFMLRQRARDPQAYPPPQPCSEASVGCQLCSQRFHSLLHKRRVCRLCLHAVCKTCSVRKTLYGFLNGSDLCQQKVTLCIACVKIARATSATELARKEILEEEQYGVDRHAALWMDSVDARVVLTGTSSANASSDSWSDTDISG